MSFGAHTGARKRRAASVVLSRECLFSLASSLIERDIVRVEVLGVV